MVSASPDRFVRQPFQAGAIFERKPVERRIWPVEVGDVDGNDSVSGLRQRRPHRHADQAGGAGEENVHCATMPPSTDTSAPAAAKRPIGVSGRKAARCASVTSRCSPVIVVPGETELICTLSGAYCTPA
jgi:hypothetical protein